MGQKRGGAVRAARGPLTPCHPVHPVLDHIIKRHAQFCVPHSPARVPVQFSVENPQLARAWHTLF